MHHQNQKIVKKASKQVSMGRSGFLGRGKLNELRLGSILLGRFFFGEFALCRLTRQLFFFVALFVEFEEAGEDFVAEVVWPAITPWLFLAAAPSG